MFWFVVFWFIWMKSLLGAPQPADTHGISGQHPQGKISFGFCTSHKTCVLLTVVCFGKQRKEMPK